jgi:hypothetical protein
MVMNKTSSKKTFFQNLRQAIGQNPRNPQLSPAGAGQAGCESLEESAYRAFQR